MALVWKMAANRGNGDGGEDQRGNDGPDDLDRGVAVGLVRLRISRLTPEPENGVDQHSLHQHEHEQGPLDRGVEQAVGNAGKIAAGKECGLGIVLRATAVSPTASRQSAVTNRERQAAVLNITRSSCS